MTHGKDDLYGYGCPVFRNITIKDIDKKAPEFKSLEYDNENWETLKHIKFTATDNIRMKSWAITKNENGPSEEEWQDVQNVTPNIEISQDITENGTYYMWIEDIAENKSTHGFNVEKVDNTPPQITYTIDNSTLGAGYVTINVTAEDTQSGLYDSPFSWDKEIWSIENATKVITANGRYKVYAEDNLGNISEQEIVIDLFPQEGTASLGEGDIISSVNVSADWNGNINNNVQITLNNNIDITAWQLTLWNQIPGNFVELEPNIPQDNNNNGNTSETNTTDNNVVENSTSNSTTNENTTENITPNIVDVRDIAFRSELIQIAEVRNTPIVINIALQIDTTYYLWIRDRAGNVKYQTFTISKAVI